MPNHTIIAGKFAFAALRIVGTFCLCLQLTAQPYFNELYRTDTSTATIFRSIVTTDTAWYITGVTVVPVPTPHNAGFFARLSTAGNLEVLKVYTDTLKNLELWNDALIITNNGNLAIVGRNQMDSGFFLTIFDANGDTLLYRHYGQEISNAITATQVQQDSENSYYVLAISGISGINDGNKVSVIKINALGDKVGQFNFPSPDPFCIYKTASDLQLLPNNHFIVSATIYGPCPFYYPPDDSCRGRTWIFEADSLGNIVWQYLSPASRYVKAPKLTLTQDGGIVFSGHETFLVNSNNYIGFNERQYIGKLNSNHELVWEYTNPYRGAAYFSRSVELADGSILVCGRIAQHLTTDSVRYAAVITKFSANGDSLGTQFYYRLSDYFHYGSMTYDRVEHYFQDMVMLSDSSLVMVGEIIDGWTPSPTAGYWAWVVHTDKYGCVEQEGCFPVGISPPPLNDHTSSLSIAEVKAYPNPARDYVTFAYNVPSKTEAILLVITDPTGKEITQLPLTNLSGELLWDTRTIPAGLYYYSVLSGADRLASGTVSIVK